MRSGTPSLAISWLMEGADGAVRPAAGPRGRGGRRLARRAAWRERPRKICGQKDTPTADWHVLVAAPAGYFAAFFLRSAQEAVIRSETAFFSSAVIGRRFLVGLASDAVSATGVAAAAGRREEERRAAGFAGAEVPSISSTSFNALISACRRSISLWRSAIAFAITLISFPRGCIVRRSTRSRLRPSVFQWVPILAQREFGGQTEPAQSTLPFPTTRSIPASGLPPAARVGPSEHQSCDRPRLGAARVHHPTRAGDRGLVDELQLRADSRRRPAAIPGTVHPGPTWCKRASPMFWCDKGHSNPDGLAVIGGSSVEPARPARAPQTLRWTWNARW